MWIGSGKYDKDRLTDEKNVKIKIGEKRCT